MKKLLTLTVAGIILTFTSCEKLSKECYVCHENNTGNDLETRCGLTPDQAKKLEKANGWTCYKVD